MPSFPPPILRHCCLALFFGAPRTSLTPPYPFLHAETSPPSSTPFRARASPPSMEDAVAADVCSPARPRHPATTATSRLCSTTTVGELTTNPSFGRAAVEREKRREEDEEPEPSIGRSTDLLERRFPAPRYARVPAVGRFRLLLGSAQQIWPARRFFFSAFIGLENRQKLDLWFKST